VMNEDDATMKSRISGSLLFVLLSATITLGADESPAVRTPTLSADYVKQRTLILPNPKEQSYRTIDWRTSVLRGVVDAQKGSKPVMIVLMNGHPLGCT